MGYSALDKLMQQTRFRSTGRGDPEKRWTTSFSLHSSPRLKIQWSQNLTRWKTLRLQKGTNTNQAIWRLMELPAAATTLTDIRSRCQKLIVKNRTIKNARLGLELMTGSKKSNKTRMSSTMTYLWSSFRIRNVATSLTRRVSWCAITKCRSSTGLQMARLSARTLLSPKTWAEHAEWSPIPTAILL